jgi:hypothetical protein
VTAKRAHDVPHTTCMQPLDRATCVQGTHGSAICTVEAHDGRAHRLRPVICIHTISSLFPRKRGNVTCLHVPCRHVSHDTRDVYITAHPV